MSPTKLLEAIRHHLDQNGIHNGHIRLSDNSITYYHTSSHTYTAIYINHYPETYQYQHVALRRVKMSQVGSAHGLLEQTIIELADPNSLDQIVAAIKQNNLKICP